MKSISHTQNVYLQTIWVWNEKFSPIYINENEFSSFWYWYVIIIRKSPPFSRHSPLFLVCEWLIIPNSNLTHKIDDFRFVSLPRRYFEIHHRRDEERERTWMRMYTHPHTCNIAPLKPSIHPTSFSSSKLVCMPSTNSTNIYIRHVWGWYYCQEGFIWLDSADNVSFWCVHANEIQRLKNFLAFATFLSPIHHMNWKYFDRYFGFSHNTKNWSWNSHLTKYLPSLSIFPCRDMRRIGRTV